MPALLPVKKESSLVLGNKTICGGGGVVLEEEPTAEARGGDSGDAQLDVFAMAAAGLYYYYYYYAVMTLR